MSLDYPTAYQTALQRPFKENWLIKLFYDSDPDNNPNNCVKLAFGDTTVDGQFYHGAILNNPQSRESIDLITGTAKNDNINLAVANFQYQGNNLSAELLGGTNKYINKTVLIYSQLNDESTLANCHLIYEGRLVEISHNETRISLLVVQQRPWDKLTIPNEKTITKPVYIPVAYGDFDLNPYSTYSSPQFITDLAGRKYRPVKLNRTANHRFYYPHLDENAAAYEGRVAIYDKNAEKFLPVESNADDVLDENGYNVKATDTLKRGFKARPESNEEVSTDPNITKSNLGNAYNTNDADYASFSINVVQVTNVYTHVEDFILPTFSGDHSQGLISLKYEVVVTSIDGASTRIKIVLDGENGTITKDNIISSVAVTTETQTLTDSPIGRLRLTIEFTVDGSLNAEVRIYDMFEKLEMIEGDPQHEIAYVGAEGLSQSYNGGSGSAKRPHQAHRDILARFCGFDVANADLEGWDSLNTDRASWLIRWWVLDPEPVKNILQRLQYEGCFIFKFRPGGEGKYIHVLNSYNRTQGDVDQKLTRDDINNLKISQTSLAKLITKMVINYERHPAERKYITKVESVNSTARSNWFGDVNTKENIKEINLDFYVAPTIPTSPSTNPNDDFYSYYDNIFGVIKLIVSMNIVNPLMYDLEVGDIIEFDNMLVNPFGYNWTDRAFMVTKVIRSVGNRAIEAKEVGSIV